MKAFILFQQRGRGKGRVIRVYDRLARDTVCDELEIQKKKQCLSEWSERNKGQQVRREGEKGMIISHDWSDEQVRRRK